MKPVIVTWLRAHSSAVLVLPFIAGVGLGVAFAPSQLWQRATTVSGLVAGALLLRLLRIRWREMWRWHRTVFRYHCICTNRLLLRYDPASLKKHQVTQIVTRTESCLA